MVPTHPHERSVARVVLVVLFLVAAIILAILGAVDNSVNPLHLLAASTICNALAIALLVFW